MNSFLLVTLGLTFSISQALLPNVKADYNKRKLDVKIPAVNGSGVMEQLKRFIHWPKAGSNEIWMKKSSRVITRVTNLVLQDLKFR